VEKIKGKLETYLKETQEKLNMPEIRYYTQSKFRYEFEIPDSLTRHLPSDFDITSKLTKVKRYQTNAL